MLRYGAAAIAISSVALILLYIKHRRGLEALPLHLRFKIHNDYTFPLCFIARTLTAYICKRPPKILFWHNINYKGYMNGIIYAHPIQTKLKGKFCSWFIAWPLYFSISFKWGWYFIIGARFDAVDYYYNFPTVDISKIGGFEP
jgi:hypothetical protein